MFAPVVTGSFAGQILIQHGLDSNNITYEALIHCYQQGCRPTRPSAFARLAMARRSFTFFEARSINFAIVVQSECMRIEEKEVTFDEKPWHPDSV